MREFLSHNSVDYEERNIAKEPRWRASLQALTGEAVVPVLLVGGKQVIGLDAEMFDEMRDDDERHARRLADELKRLMEHGMFQERRAA